MNNLEINRFEAAADRPSIKRKPISVENPIGLAQQMMVDNHSLTRFHEGEADQEGSNPASKQLPLGTFTPLQLD